MPHPNTSDIIAPSTQAETCSARNVMPQSMEEEHRTLQPLLKALDERKKREDEERRAKFKFSLLKDGFPPRMEFYYGTDGGLRTAMLEDMSVEHESFAVLTDLEPLEHPLSHTWWHYHPRNQFECRGRNGILMTIMSALEDVGRCAGFETVLGSQKPWSSCCPDLSLAIDNRVLGAVDVVMASDHFAESLYHTQKSMLFPRVHAYLLELRKLYGAVTPAVVVNSNIGSVVCWHEYAATSAFTNIGTDGFARTLYVTELLKPDAHDVVATNTALVKLCHVKNEPYDRAWRLITKDAVKFVSDGPKLHDMELREMVPRDTDEFYVWEVLHMGTEGAVFLMGAKNNSCCVVKTCGDPEYERLLWVKAYGPGIDVWTIQFNGSLALVMPYFNLLGEDEFRSEKGRKLIEQHKSDLAGRGVEHHGIKRGSVVWADESREAVLFIRWDNSSQRRALETMSDRNRD